MPRLFSAFIFLTAAAALGLPNGLSGIGVGAGGVFGSADGFVQGEFDFGLSPYVSLGPEISFAFDTKTLMPGCAGRVYFIPKMDFFLQPFASFGGGYYHMFGGVEEDEIPWPWWDSARAPRPSGPVVMPAATNDDGGYCHFGGGMDFDVLGVASPYCDLGCLLAFGDGTSVYFKLEGGFRFGVW